MMRSILARGLMLVLLSGMAFQSMGCGSGVTDASTPATVPDTPITTSTTAGSATVTPTATTLTTVPVTSSPPVKTFTGTPTPQPPVVLANGANSFTKLGFVAERFKDAATFDNKYKDTIFQVTGVVTGIDARQGFLVVDDGSVPPDYPYDSKWQCFFATDLDLEINVSQIMDLKLGQTVTVQGPWGFRIIGDKPSDPVYLGYCTLMSVS